MVNERVRAYIKIVYKNKIVMGIISKSVRLEKVCNCNETFYNGLKSEKSYILQLLSDFFKSFPTVCFTKKCSSIIRGLH